MADHLLYRIKLRRGDFEIEVQGDKDYVESKFKELVDTQPFPKTAQPLTPQTKVLSTDGSKPLSLREFVDQYNTTAHMDFVLLIGYYLEKYRGQDSFTVTDIKNAYAEMREKLTNAGPFITQNVRKGFLMEAPAKEGIKKAMYSLTRKGMQFIEGGLSLPD